MRPQESQNRRVLATDPDPSTDPRNFRLGTVRVKLADGSVRLIENVAVIRGAGLDLQGQKLKTLRVTVMTPEQVVFGPGEWLEVTITVD